MSSRWEHLTRLHVHDLSLLSEPLNEDLPREVASSSELVSSILPLTSYFICVWLFCIGLATKAPCFPVRHSRTNVAIITLSGFSCCMLEAHVFDQMACGLQLCAVEDTPYHGEATDPFDVLSCFFEADSVLRV
jgi:hypothetical protein